MGGGRVARSTGRMRRSGDNCGQNIVLGEEEGSCSGICHNVVFTVTKGCHFIVIFLFHTPCSVHHVACL